MTDKSNNSKTIRPPIVVILGHVDHGKTSILDKIRETKIAAKEAGGITQHVGAYQVEHKGSMLTFLDTPGHEAFGAIRARGAHVADVAILVIAADEGIKPQTKESIKILKESETPFVVAINKIDTKGADPMRVRQQLAENDVLVEDYGGQVPVNEISARTGDGIDALLETVALLAEVEELTADASALAKGVVIEAHTDKFKGTVATLLVLDGTLALGDILVTGSAVCRVKALEDFLGRRIKEVLPSQPCVVLGWESLPALGIEFEVVKDKKIAEKKAKEFESKAGALFVSTIEDVHPAVAAVQALDKEYIKPLVANLIVKTDVQSSLEAIDQTFQTIKSEKVSYRVVDFGVGDVSDTDVKNAKAKKASIVGFGVSVDKSASQMAERESIRIETSNIIYKLVEVVREIMASILPAEVSRTLVGKLKILAIFGNQGKSQIVGGKVTTGKAQRGIIVDINRGGAIVGIGKLGQLQQGKQDVKEVAEGNECGIRFEPADNANAYEIKTGDYLEFYEEKRIISEL